MLFITLRDFKNLKKAEYYFGPINSTKVPSGS